MNLNNNKWSFGNNNNNTSVPAENDNGRRVIDFCAEMEFFKSNTYFEHKSLYK